MKRVSKGEKVEKNGKVVAEEPLISVIVPVYNVEKYLDKCVDSIVNQTYKNLEIILVDDGSPDNCPKMCDDWARKDKRIRVIHKKNGGLSDARNAGIDCANGKYLTFIDSDDYVDKDYIEYLYYLIKKNNSDMSIASHKILNGKRISTKYKKIDEVNINSHDALQRLLYDDCLDTSAWAKMFDISLFNNIRFPVGRLYEDAATIYKLIDKCDKIELSTKPIYNYIIRNDSISQNSFSIKKLDLIKSTEEMKEYIENRYSDLNEGCNRRLMFSYLSTLSQLANSKNKYQSIEENLMKYIKNNRRSVLKDKRIPKRDKYAIYCTYFGFNFYKIIWKIYLKII